MKILFIGGNGNISWYCVNKAIECGHEVWEVNRAKTRNTRRDVQSEVIQIICDIHDPREMNREIGHLNFDVVCDFICYNRKDAENAVKFYRDKTKQYIFISSSAVYDRNKSKAPFDEKMPLYSIDEVCSYTAGKIEAENVFINAYEEFGFPVTIVRPAYTYDTIVPVSIGHNCFTIPQMLLEGWPLLIAGDGENMMSFTHSYDFANFFQYLWGKGIGEIYNLASDELLSWNKESSILMKELGVVSPRYIHICEDEAANINCYQPRDMMIERMKDNYLDVEKIKQIVPKWGINKPFEIGIKETIAWLHEKEERKRIISNYWQEYVKLVKRYM